MRLVLAFAALMPAFDGADAQDIFSTLQFPTSSRQIHGDAPSPIVRKQGSELDISSTAAIDEPSRSTGMMSSPRRYGDAAPPMKIYHAPNGVGHSSAASMTGHAPKERVVTTPRALYGSD
jgi:hypothetical protein